VSSAVWFGFLAPSDIPRRLGGSGAASITIAQFGKPFSVKLMSVAAVNTADDRVFAN